MEVFDNSLIFYLFFIWKCMYISSFFWITWKLKPKGAKVEASDRARELHSGNNRFTRRNGSDRKRVSKVKGDDDFVLYAHFQVACHEGEYRYMIDRSMRACLASSFGTVTHTGACKRQREEGPSPV